MPQVGFIRTKVLQADRPGGLTNPFVAVNVKEAMNIPGQCAIYRRLNSHQFQSCLKGGRRGTTSFGGDLHISDVACGTLNCVHHINLCVMCSTDKTYEHQTCAVLWYGQEEVRAYGMCFSFPYQTSSVYTFMQLPHWQHCFHSSLVICLLKVISFSLPGNSVAMTMSVQIVLRTHAISYYRLSAR